MLYDPATVPHLKPWLVRTLGPICDAEPAALAEYVLALLKHNLPETEMRKELTAQLEEFLEKEGPSFIDTLFTVLRTKSYLPYTTSSPPPQSSSSNSHPTDAGIPIPLDGLLSNSTPSSERAQKRALSDDDRDALRPAKGPRLAVDAQFPRYPTGLDTRSTGQWGPRNDRQGPANGTGSAVNGQRIQTYQPPDQRRGVCRDYHNNGYCARGALCKYSHGDDAFVPSQLFAMGAAGGQMPFLPMFPGGAMPFGLVGPGAAYDPHEARMDMRPSGNVMGMNGRAPPFRPPLLHRSQEDSSPSAPTSGELPVIQDLTPQALDDTIDTASQPPQPPQLPQVGTAWTQSAPPPQQLHAMDVDMDAAPQNVHAGPGGTRGGFRGGGRGTFSGEAQSFRPERRNDKTLVVEKIPEDKLSLDAVNSWFKRFGTVTNVAIDARTAKALVSFSEHNEAHAAWKSEDAVFGNRFVKVFWHRPMEGHGQKGARMLAASGPLVASIVARSATPTAPSTGVPSPTPRKPAVASNATAELAAKQKLLEEQIAEQKSLMASLATASGEEKKTTMARLRKLGEEMKPSSSPSPISGEVSTHSTAATQQPASSTEHPVPHGKEREWLDKELDLHVVRDDESTAELQAKLAKLKEEAASLGIPEEGDYSYSGGSYRPYRGRGRGGRGGRGAFFRGSGRGVPRGSMKLDNRPKKLLVKGVREEAIPSLREWYGGQLDSIDSVGDDKVLVGFRTRAAAEQALAKGSDIPSVGVVHVSWHTIQQSFPSSQTLTVSSSRLSVPENESEDAHSSSLPTQQGLPSTRRQEEEIIASGWGDGGDEDDMGFR